MPLPPPLLLPLSLLPLPLPPPLLPLPPPPLSLLLLRGAQDWAAGVLGPVRMLPESEGWRSDAPSPIPPWTVGTAQDRLKIWWADPGKPVAMPSTDGPESRGPSPTLPAPPLPGGGGAEAAAGEELAVLAPESPSKALAGCISLFTASQAAIASKRFLRTSKPAAGASIKVGRAGQPLAVKALAWH